MAASAPQPVGGGSLGEALEGPLRELLATLPQTPRPPRRGRPPVVPAFLLWAGLLVGILRGQSSQRQLWRLLTVHGLWDYARVQVEDMAIYQRLARTPPTALQEFFNSLSAALRQRLDALGAADAVPWAPFASALVVLDHTKLDPLLRKLKVLREVPPGDLRLLPGALATLFDLRRQQWLHVAFQAGGEHNVKFGLGPLLAQIPPGTLLLFDLGYFAFAWFDQLTHRGIHYVSRWREKTSCEVLHVFYDDREAPDDRPVRLYEALVYLGAYRSDRAAHAVRQIEIRFGGRCWRFLTNVLDPRQLPAAHVVELYRRRWDIEQAFNLLKTHLKLSLLWSGHENVLLHQVFATLCIAQIVLALRREIAQRARADLQEVSLPLMLQGLPRFAQDGFDPVAEFVRVGRRAGYIRPFRGKAYQLPSVEPTAYVLPESWPSVRSPRYAQRKCGPRPRSTSRKPANGSRPPPATGPPGWRP